MSIVDSGKINLLFVVKFLKLLSVNVIRGLGNKKQPGLYLTLFVMIINLTR